jgi:hypothetical protein
VELALVIGQHFACRRDGAECPGDARPTAIGSLIRAGQSEMAGKRMSRVDSPAKPNVAPGLRWTLWLSALAVYTYLLVVPNEWLPPWLQRTIGAKITPGFTFGKVCHIASYATLTIATFALPVSWRGWLISVAVLSAHGFGTEYIQTFTGRHGCWQDVGIDHIGIATGLLLGGLGYRLWGRRPHGPRPDRESAAPQVQAHAGRENQDADPL